MIQIKNLSKTFIQNKNQVHALKNVDIHIEKGDIFGIIGMSGAGKSTLLRCLRGLEKPTEGDILLGGISVVNAKNGQLTALRRNMGVVFQGYNLLMQRTVYENIAFPLKIAGISKEETEKRVDRLLEVVDMADKKHVYPSQLSGGQKQRVAIARALATQPEILLCDEPTSALDPMTTRQVLKLLQEISENLGVTIVIITHEINVVKNICNRVAVISDGEIDEIGFVKEVFTSPQSQVTKSLLDWQV
ncbi:MAG: ATP-binding cassette domain-containing protein [Oscillospiraceae bacterium]|nr:ATP-binding cassette domain-containing protein [Oscillospiraceae bacterium]